MSCFLQSDKKYVFLIMKTFQIQDLEWFKSHQFSLLDYASSSKACKLNKLLDAAATYCWRLAKSQTERLPSQSVPLLYRHKSKMSLKTKRHWLLPASSLARHHTKTHTRMKKRFLFVLFWVLHYLCRHKRERGHNTTEMLGQIKQLSRHGCLLLCLQCHSNNDISQNWHSTREHAKGRYHFHQGRIKGIT